MTSGRAIIGELAGVAFLLFVVWYEGWPFFDAVSAADAVPLDKVIFHWLKAFTLVVPGVVLPAIILLRRNKKPKEVTNPDPDQMPEFGFGFGFVKPDFMRVFEEAIKQRAMDLLPFEEGKEATGIKIVGKIEGMSPPMSIRGSKFAFVGSGREFTVEIGTKTPGKAPGGESGSQGPTTSPLQEPPKELTA